MRDMKDSRFSLVVVLAASLALVLGCPPTEPEPEEPPPPEPEVEEPEPEPEPEEPDEVVIEMTDTRFEPQEVTVRVGQTVRWRNTSQLVHTVTADPDRAADPGNVELPEGADTFDSGDIPPGEEYSRELTEAGTYRYICVPHEAAGMTGTITVEEQENEQPE